MPKIKIPTPLRQYTGGDSEVEVDGETAGEIRYLDGADTEVSEGDELSIIPSIAGGCAGRRCR
jgi:molybdopterin synthase sulfur carrier subunit